MERSVELIERGRTSKYPIDTEEQEKIDNSDVRQHSLLESDEPGSDDNCSTRASPGNEDIQEREVNVDISDERNCIRLPRPIKCRILIWNDIDYTEAEKLLMEMTPETTRRFTSEIIDLTDYSTDQREILLDLYYYTIKFARKNRFTAEKLSTLFSIIKELHHACEDTPFGNVDHVFNYFEELLLCHSLKRPPFSIELFTTSDVQAISLYVVNNFFRHFKLYKYAFTAQPSLSLTFEYPGLPPETMELEETISTEEEKTEEEIEEEEERDEEEKFEKLVSESAAAKELSEKIQQQLEKELKALKENMDERLHEAEENIKENLKKLGDAKSPKHKKK